MPALHLQISSPPQEIPVFIGSNLWQELVSFLLNNFPDHSVFVITDSHLAKIYSTTIKQQLNALSSFKKIFVFPAGEESKSREEKARLEDALLHGKAGRDSVILAVGGGVTGDLAGFVAATLHRGVPFIQVPTSLLAQTDSSIGGKVGINHPAGKNLLGAFYQPAAIFTDIRFLITLPEEEFRNGMAEVIKYAVILDEKLYQWLEAESTQILNKETTVLEKIIRRCVELKIRVVQRDEKESNYRSILNFGHTVGHALEKLTAYSVKHGEAVAEGMRVAARLSARLLNYPTEQVDRLDRLLDTYGLARPDVRRFPAEQIWEAIQSDKKARQQTPRFTLLRAPQTAQLFHPVKKEELIGALSVL